MHQGFPAHPHLFLRAPRQHPPVCAPSPPQARWPFGALCLDYSEPIGLISPTTSVCPHNLWQIAACSGQKTEQGPWQRVRAINPLPAERGAHTRQPWRQHPKCQGLGGCKGQRRVQELQGDTLGWGLWGQAFCTASRKKRMEEPGSRGCRALLFVPSQWLLQLDILPSN